LGQYFQEEIAKPLKLDFHIGLPEEIPDERIAKITMLNPLKALFNINKLPAGMRKVILNVNSPFMKSVTLIKGYDPNDRATWRVEQPSGNGIGTARSAGCLYSILARGGKELKLKVATMKHLTALPQIPMEGYLNQVINIEIRYGMGFMKPDQLFAFADNTKAFSFLEATGSFAFGDPKHQIGYAYFTNKKGYYGINDPREKSLREAMYRCI